MTTMTAISSATSGVLSNVAALVCFKPESPVTK
jgi:hypothetical protein